MVLEQKENKENPFELHRKVFSELRKYFSYALGVHFGPPKRAEIR